MYVGHVFNDFPSHGERRQKCTLIFCNMGVLADVYRTCTFISMDETFKTMSVISNDLSDCATQMRLSTADRDQGKLAVVLIVIMQCQKRSLYKKAFSALKLKQPDFKPAQMISDYECAMRWSFLEIFPDT